MFEDKSDKEHFPSLSLSQLIFEFESKKCVDGDLATKIQDALRKYSMAPLYSALCSKFSWPFDDRLHGEMVADNEKKLESFEKKLAEALERQGDMEVLDTIFEKAEHFSCIGDFPSAVKTYDEVIARDKTSTQRKIDAWMCKSRLALFDMNLPNMKDCLAECKRLIELGGDWDRRNRVKVYEGLYLIAKRDIKGAAALLYDGIATFTCYEICTYKQFMFYAVLTNIMALPRTSLEKKIVHNPQVITILRELPQVRELLTSIYNCEYRTFFVKLTEIYDSVCSDRYIGMHSNYIFREFRILAYSQFLEAYRSVLLSSMAASFGLTSGDLDAELSRFISSGRLSAKIDKVGDVVENFKPDRRNLQYQDVIKKGDVLLNSVQKLARIFDV